MKLVNDHETFRLYEHKLETPFDCWTSPFPGEAFAGLVAILDHGALRACEHRTSLAARLLDEGCRSCTAWGFGSDDFICQAYYETHYGRFENRDVPDDQMVMGAWSGESDPNDAVEKFFLTSDFGDLVFRNYLALLVGTCEKREYALRASIDKALSNAREFTEMLREPFLGEYIRRLRQGRSEE